MSGLACLLRPLAYISLPVFLAHTASKNSILARYYIRLCIYVSTLSVVSVWGVVVSIAMNLVGRRQDVNYVIARCFHAVASRALDIHFEVEGEEHLSITPSVLIGNHQSMLDILYLGRIFPKSAAMLAKKELFWTPFLGQYLLASGAIGIDRGNNAKAVKSLADAGQAMKARGLSLWLFPEGTRTNAEKPDLLPFKKGAFYVAIQAGVPITPVVCENYWRLYHKGLFKSGTLKIRVLPPIPTASLSLSDVAQLAQATREQMLAALHELSGTRPESSDKRPEGTSQVAALPQHQPPTPSDDASVQDATDSEEGSAPIAPSSEETGSVGSRREGSDMGAETEEDEGMVLVGRPGP